MVWNVYLLKFMLNVYEYFVHNLIRGDRCFDQGQKASQWQRSVADISSNVHIAATIRFSEFDTCDYFV